MTAVSPAGAKRAPGRAVTGLAMRQVRRGAGLVIAVTAGMSALVAATYRSTMGSGSRVEALAALAGNPAIRTLFGEPAALDDPGGFTVWRTGTVVAVLVGTWGLLAATRVTRGEEDSGRWDLLLAGRLPMRAVVGRQLVVLAIVMVSTGVAVTVAMVAAGTGLTGAVLHGAGLALLGLFFVGAGVACAQIFASRAAASGAAVALLGLGMVLRMAGDGIGVLAWLRWLSPFGLLELTRPYDTGRWMPLVVLAAAAAAALAGGWAAATGRDLRGGWLSPGTGRAPRMTLLGSVQGFAVRRTLGPVAGWAAGIGAYFLIVGLVAVSLTGFLTDNPEFADLAARAGFGGLGSVEGYAATLFALLAMPVGGFVTTRITTVATDERDRRFALLLAGPVTRWRAGGAEVTAAAGGAVLLTVVAGLATWAGTGLAGAHLRISAALGGAVNVLPVALLSLGAAVIALGVVPRAAGWIGGVPTVGGFLLLVTADSTGAPEWVGALSPFAHLAPVPAEGVSWTGTAVMAILAAVLCAAGLAAFARRDVRT
ncbi:hypothetical protein AB0C12_28200 [Actinoplanes sp. NPDC048967]|uniref:ABC transporter permease n=1 Tax=Actinoplanes sp. NPDC048967 TaxID=3155269 RepID=UPI0033FA914E